MIPHFSLPNIIPNTPPESPRIPPPQTTRSTASSSTIPLVAERTQLVPVYLNNRFIYVEKDLKKDVCEAADFIFVNYTNALKLKKELILSPDILIELVNHAKFYWHPWVEESPKGLGLPETVCAVTTIESVFINNQNLSKEESDWVRQIISDYKNIVEVAISKSNLNPIPPIWMVHKESVRKKCSCNIL